VSRSESVNAWRSLKVATLASLPEIIWRSIDTFQPITTTRPLAREPTAPLPL
jgi:hypothetical protein